MSADGTDWTVTRIVSVTDGDSLRVIRRRTTPAGDGLNIDIYDAEPAGVPIRLITLDTPERGKVGYLDARRDVLTWLMQIEAKPGLSITTWPDGGFGRHLGDIWVTGRRSETLSQWMLRERGWLPYVRGQ